MNDPISWTDPGRMGGIPCVHGTRVPIDDIVGLIYDCTDYEIWGYYPTVTVEQVARIRNGER